MALGTLSGAWAFVLPGAQAAAFPAYPRTCPIAHQVSYYTFAPNCLVDNETLESPGGGFTNQRSDASVTVRPEVVRYGERFTVVVHTPLPPCAQDTVPGPPSGCYDRSTGYSGISLRLLPVPAPVYVASANFPNLRQSGHCYAPTRCSFWFVRPPRGQGATLTNHWIVAQVRMTTNLGIAPGEAGAAQDPQRQHFYDIEKAVRLCAPSKPCSHEVSGRVTEEGSHQGASGLPVRAACADGGATTTDASGNYSFVLSPGTCRISVTPPKGLKATPKQRVVHVTSRNISGVDFKVSCGAEARATAATDCPVKVFLKVVGPIPNVGTRSGLALNSDLINEGPLNFTTGVFSKTPNNFSEPFEPGQKCMSGCANLLVSVVDPKTHKPPDLPAKVSVQLGQIDTQMAPALRQRGSQFVCTQSDNPATAQCATQLTDLTTDPQGQLHLIYWAPGEVVKAHTNLKVKVTPTCDTNSCPGGGKPVSQTTNLTVKPYLIYHKHGELEPEEVRLLIAMARSQGLAPLGSGAAHKFLEVQLEWLAHQQLIAKQAVEAVSGPYGWALVLGAEIGAAWSEYKEELGVIDGFLKGVDMRGIGPDDEPFERQIPADTNPTFQQLLLSGAANVGHFQAGGLLWTLGQTLSRQLKHLKRDKVVPEHVDMSVYEVSNCNERDPVCGPGYAASDGIKPQLCFFVKWSNTLPGGDYEDNFCVFQYDALAFAETQPGLIKDPPR